MLINFHLVQMLSIDYLFSFISHTFDLILILVLINEYE